MNIKKLIFDKLRVLKGSRVLEIGIGGDYFVKGFSERVGKDGKVYYFDVKREALDKIMQLQKINAEAYHLHGGEYKIEGELDLIFLNDCYYKFADRIEYFRYMKKYLAPHGKVAIVQNDVGWNINTLLGQATKRKTIIDEMYHAGFKLRNEYFFLKNKSYLIFEKE